MSVGRRKEKKSATGGGRDVHGGMGRRACVVRVHVRPPAVRVLRRNVENLLDLFDMFCLFVNAPKGGTTPSASPFSSASGENAEIFLRSQRRELGKGLRQAGMTWRNHFRRHASRLHAGSASVRRTGKGAFAGLGRRKILRLRVEIPRLSTGPRVVCRRFLSCVLRFRDAGQRSCGLFSCPSGGSFRRRRPSGMRLPAGVT